MGVCSGLGRHTGIDPVVFRVGFAVLLLGSGIGLFLYLAAFLLMKEPNGKPGIIEQWTRRDFDAETVMALMTAVMAFGLALNLATVWLDTGTLVVAVLLAVSLLAAHSSGVDLLGLARSMPERLSRRQTSAATEAPPVRPTPPAGPSPVASMPSPEGARPAPPPVATPAAAPPPVKEPAVPKPVQEAETVQEAEPVQEAETAREVGEERGPEPPTRMHEAVPPAPTGEDTKVTAEHRVPSYQPQPRTRADYSPYGEPFAPKGPYQPLDPAKRAAGYSPYDPVLYGRPVPKKERKPRPKSFIGAITILLAIIIGGIVVAVQARSAAGVSPTIVGGALLITIGAGLLVAAWWGRGAGLVAAGTLVAVVVALGFVLGGVPRNIGESDWTPTSVTQSSILYDVGVGDGRLDLSELKLTPGAEVTFNAAVTMGELVVVVPPTARIEVHATNKVGDIKLDHSVRGGVDVRYDKVLEPEVEPDGKVSTIVLNLRGGLGDMEVRRAA
ncbi:phage shock protein PspC (stress-responsive transcriptional regulator)/outer membrane biosynthesis protein TonB [Nonomuraea jabiensis]|uniref:Phage shock protein PspC (Stress-responsive transcriptional regulator)/outer membrane biosynthesis protein TonB n=2 Tax=Nonomuraea jabiensis TaxID=882448 RepID=A0A7W9G4L7_9ACTN|nr:phage shock protein PspC (stress-responsive transcriptional regulator)/outer membrane biosynthesis protein TonB [Nonomuraea jabiensis]